jgi:hypothetical protein
MKIQEVEKRQVKLRLGLCSVSGAGKTYSSLLLAKGLCGEWSKICVIDTEHNSSQLYASLGGFNSICVEQPYTPERLIEAIELCERARMEVIIIDSISNSWSGTGGILDIHSNMAGNSFTNWNIVGKRHTAFVDKILQSTAHIITTIRSKQHYVINSIHGKAVPQKVGMKAIMRSDFEFELTSMLDLDMDHMARCSKDRTGILNHMTPFIISEGTGEILKEWCEMDSSLPSIIDEINSAKTIADLKQINSTNPKYQKQIRESLSNKKQQLLAVDTKTSIACEK